MPPLDLVTMMLVEDDHGHALLLKHALRRGRITNPLITFHDGQEAIDYLFAQGQYPGRSHDLPLLLLSIDFPAWVVSKCFGGCELMHSPRLFLSSC
jgi:hypothetical protein